MSDGNTEARGKIARAIVYAARQAFEINSFGMTWEAIEVNTYNILAGCSVPADGKMNSAEAVAERISPNHAKLQLSEANAKLATQLMDATRAKREHAEAVKYARELEQIIDEQRAQLAEWKLAASNTARERDGALSERDEINHRFNLSEEDNMVLRRLLTDEREARELDVIRLSKDRDGFRKGAQRWKDQAELTAAERNKAGADLVFSQADLERANTKVVKLRTVLEDLSQYLPPWASGFKRTIQVLEETK